MFEMFEVCLFSCNPLSENSRDTFQSLEFLGEFLNAFELFTYNRSLRKPERF
jgi:hypothetical protein